jgi:hypothetical protein
MLLSVRCYNRYTVACEPRLACFVILGGPRAVQRCLSCFPRLYALCVSYRGQMKAFAHCVSMALFANDFNASAIISALVQKQNRIAAPSDQSRRERTSGAARQRVFLQSVAGFGKPDKHNCYSWNNPKPR